MVKKVITLVRKPGFNPESKMPDYLIEEDDDPRTIDKTLSYDSGREIIEQSPCENIYVDLSDRAIAINAIMAACNQESRVKGIGSDPLILSERYGSAKRGNEVLAGMKAKSKRLADEAEEHFEKLVSAAAMRKSGFEEFEVQSEINDLKRGFNEKYGPGNSNAADREKLVKKVQSTAKIQK